MDIGAYITASAMKNNQKVLSSIAHNMANSLTPGFKGEMARLASVPLAVSDEASLQGMTPLAYVQLLPPVTNDKQGVMEKTGRKFDLAIKGDGYFQVRTREGLQKSRGGSLQVNPEGILVDREGRPIMGDDGKKIEIGDQGGDIMIRSNGEILEDGEEMGSLLIVNKNGKPAREGDFGVWQGYLEMSNVNSVEEMIRMMEVMRNNESCTKMIRAFDEIEEKLIREVGRA